MAAVPPRPLISRPSRRTVWLSISAAALVGCVAAAVVADVPHRIVSLVPATTEMLFAMGAGGKVVGVSSYDRHPTDVERLPRVGALLDPNVERILSLKPDLVIVYDTQADLKQQLERAGIQFFAYRHRGLPDVMDTIRELGARVGAAPAANALADRMERSLADIRARTSAIHRPKALLIFGREPGSLRNIAASGGYGFLHDLLDVAGGDDVLGDIRRESVMMSTEMILARAPEVIVELQYSESASPESSKSDEAVWSALPAVPAVKNRQIYVLRGDHFVVPGPRIVEAARQLAGVLHPDVFR
jgi:iron complex transport system substrate-binding protein